MTDVVNTNRKLLIKRYEHAKLVAQSNIYAREIRIMELEEEIVRCQIDVEAQNKVIIENDNNIRLQLEAIEDDKSNLENHVKLEGKDKPKV